LIFFTFSKKTKLDVCDAGYSLSSGLQLADLKEHHEIIFAVTGSGLRAGHGCQLGRRYCDEEGDKECKRG